MSDIVLLLPHLRALKGQVDALLFLAEMHAVGASESGAQPVQTDPEACPECGAPVEKQVKAPSMSGTTVACLVCGHTRKTANAPQQVS